MGKLTVQFVDAEGKTHCLGTEFVEAQKRLKERGDEPGQRALKRRKARWEHAMSAFFFDVCSAGRDSGQEVQQ